MHWTQRRLTARAMTVVGGAMVVASVVLGGERPEATAQTVSGQIAYETAPDLFDATDTAIWDGKRTLQGLWVAHPDARSAQRVRIVNVETGTEIDGALFRRDASLAGPPVLISSEAAKALGMEPGYPIEIRIIAVRAVNVTAPQPVTETATPTASAPETAATPAVERVPPPVPVAEPAKTDAGAKTPRPAVPVPPPVAAPAAPPAAPPVVASKQPVPDPEAATVPAPTAAPGAMPLARPFVAAGVYRDRNNADRMIAALRADGLPVTGAPVRLGSGPATRVTAGPFDNAATRDRAIARIRALGVPDAYAFAR